jgi:hypothetical protein
MCDIVPVKVVLQKVMRMTVLTPVHCELHLKPTTFTEYGTINQCVLMLTYDGRIRQAFAVFT